MNDEFDRQDEPSFVIRREWPVGATVTVHELGHKVPKQAEREFAKAWTARDKGDRTAAIASFQKAIAIDPEYCAALNDLGTTYLDTNQVSLAIEQFDKAIAIDPHAPKPYTNLAIAFLKQEQFRDAERAARRVIDLDPSDTRGNLTLGLALLYQNKVTDEMQWMLNKAASDFPSAHLWLAEGLLTRGNVDAARDHVNRYYASGDKTADAFAKAVLKDLEHGPGSE